MKKKTLEEHGREIGKRILEERGPGHFAQMGQSSMAKQKAKDPDIFKKRGRNGYLARLKKDPHYLEKMRRKRWGKKPTAIEILLDR